MWHLLDKLTSSQLLTLLIVGMILLAVTVCSVAYSLSPWKREEGPDDGADDSPGRAG
jgi:hypothetical protein